MDAEDEVALAAWILEQEEIEAAEEESGGEAEEGEEDQQVKIPTLVLISVCSLFVILPI
jgi:hypothetical protein